MERHSSQRGHMEWGCKKGTTWAANAGFFSFQFPCQKSKRVRGLLLFFSFYWSQQLLLKHQTGRRKGICRTLVAPSPKLMLLVLHMGVVQKLLLRLLCATQLLFIVVLDLLTLSSVFFCTYIPASSYKWQISFQCRCWGQRCRSPPRLGRWT